MGTITLSDTQKQMANDALVNATSRDSTFNYGAIFEGFTLKGIPVDQIQPRVNVFTYHAWIALGKKVKRGEHGVKVCTWVKREKEDKAGEKKTVSFPHYSTVFHVSQVEALS